MAPETSGVAEGPIAPGSGGDSTAGMNPRSGDTVHDGGGGVFPCSNSEGPTVESCLESGIPAGPPFFHSAEASLGTALFPPTEKSPYEDGARCPAGDQGISRVLGRTCFWGSVPAQPRELGGPCKKSVADLEGKGILEMGPKVLQWVLEVFPLRSQSTGEGGSFSLFPLPTSRASLLNVFPSLETAEVSWLICICVSLNSIWGGALLYEGKVSQSAMNCLSHLVEDIKRLKALSGCLERFDWKEFFKTRAIDYKGDEVKTARRFRWENIAPALPAEIGRVPLDKVCTLGAQHYVTHFDAFVGYELAGELPRPPKVMVDDDHWPAVCNGLVKAGVCVCSTQRKSCSIGRGGLCSTVCSGYPRMNGVVSLKLLDSS